MSQPFSPQNAKCPYDFVSNTACCSSCGGCNNHFHTICDAKHGMRNVRVGNCASGDANHNGALICGQCGFCGVHSHAHVRHKCIVFSIAHVFYFSKRTREHPYLHLKALYGQ